MCKFKFIVTSSNPQVKCSNPQVTSSSPPVTTEIILIGEK